MTWRHAILRYNPELLILHNPASSRVHGAVRRKLVIKGVQKMKKHRKHRRNHLITAKVGKKRMSWKALVKRFGVKGASKKWRKGVKYHGKRTLSSQLHRSKRRKHSKHRKHAKKLGKKYIRMGKRKFSWKTLSKKYGPKKAIKFWRKHKKIHGKR